jgi:hypothetical protein
VKAITFDELIRVVRRLSNQTYVRYFMHLRPGRFIISLVDVDEHGRAIPARIRDEEMHRAGFERCEVSGLTGAVFIATKEKYAHDFYENGDPDAPDCIKDGHGEVVLQMCRRCRRAESELDEPCIAPPATTVVGSGKEGAK